MFDSPVILNLHHFKRDSYISERMSGRQQAAEGRESDAVAHLALARSQNTGNGILGDFTKDKSSCVMQLLLFCADNECRQYTLLI